MPRNEKTRFRTRIIYKLFNLGRITYDSRAEKKEDKIITRLCKIGGKLWRARHPRESWEVNLGEVNEKRDLRGPLNKKLVAEYFRLLRYLHLGSSSDFRKEWPNQSTLKLEDIPTMSDKDLVDHLIERMEYWSDRMSSYRRTYLKMLYKEIIKRGLK